MMQPRDLGNLAALLETLGRVAYSELSEDFTLEERRRVAAETILSRQRRGKRPVIDPE